MTVVVCDTSVLSYLARIEQLQLLPKLFGRVTVPSTVLAECLHPDAPELLRNALTPALHLHRLATSRRLVAFD
jgi:predicted nucleic acid-binding protein